MNNDTCKSDGNLSVLKNINNEIKNVGFSKVNFCEYIGLAPSTIYKYSTTDAIPGKEVIEKLCYGLDCSKEYLLGETDERGHSPVINLTKDRKTVLVDTNIKQIMKKGKPYTPNKLANKLGIPYSLLRKVMTFGGELPNNAVNKFMKIYNVSIEDITDSDKNLKESDNENKTSDVIFSSKLTDLPYFKNIDTSQQCIDIKKEIKEHNAHVAIETANKLSDLKMEFNEKITSLASPKDNKISLNQLAAIVSLLNQKPELLDTYVKMCSLNDEDFNHIHDNLKWQVNRLLKHIESDE